jgi:polysaccharide biosynthesis protein PslH
MKIVWILPKWPYPATDGAKKAHMALLQNWPKESILDLVIYTNEQKSPEEIEELRQLIGFNQLLLLPYTKMPKFVIFFLSLFSSNPLPTTVKRFASKKAKSSWMSWSKDKRWDVLVVDVLHPAGLFLEKNNTWSLPKVNTVCLRAHNVESEIWDQTHERGASLLKWILNIEKKRMSSFEKSFLNICDLIVPVSQVDAEKFKALNKRPSSVIPVPIGLKWINSIAQVNPSNDLELLFIGRLDWYPNEEGLSWFLEEVWPEIVENKHKTIMLHVIGSHGKGKLIKKIQSAPNVIYHGQVDDLTPFYHRVMLTIIPIFIGSGTRVKAIESALYGRSFISTTKGIEGVELCPDVDFIEANTKDDWIKAIEGLTINTCTTLGQHVHMKMKETYDKDIIQTQFVSQLKSIANANK